MFKYAALAFTLFIVTTCSEVKRQKHEDPFAALDRHISHSLAHHYLWPWTQLLRAAAAVDVEEYLEEPKIVSDDKKFEVNVFAKRFKPNELRVRVKNHYIIIEGRHKEDKTDNMRFMANHFEQRFVLPRGSKSEEVTAVFKENGVLTVTVPKHELPPERLVPIEVLFKEAEEKTDKPETTTIKNEQTTEESPSSSSVAPIEEELTEATTHVGKIRKKELKNTTTKKTTKDNEVNKVDGNGLDYALIDSEE